MILVGDTNIAPSSIDKTIPSEETPDWMKPGEYPCASLREQESWAKDVLGDDFVDAFRHLFP